MALREAGRRPSSKLARSLASWPFFAFCAAYLPTATRPPLAIAVHSVDSTPEAPSPLHFPTFAAAAAAARERLRLRVKEPPRRRSHVAAGGYPVLPHTEAPTLYSHRYRVEPDRKRENEKDRERIRPAERA